MVNSAADMEEVREATDDGLLSQSVIPAPDDARGAFQSNIVKILALFSHPYLRLKRHLGDDIVVTFELRRVLRVGESLGRV